MPNVNRRTQNQPNQALQGEIERGAKLATDLRESSTKQSKQRVPLALKLAMMALSILFSLLIAEVGLRVIGIKPSPVSYGDMRLGTSPPKSSVMVSALPDGGPVITRRTNNLGFYEDHDVPLVKPAGVERIVVVGDSQTACQCVNAQSFPHLLQAKLNEQNGGQKYEVINAGAGRYSPYQYYLRFEYEAISLKPDQIIVAFYVGNDFLDLIRQDDRPYITVNADGSFTEHPPVFLVYRNPSDRGGWLEERSRAYSVLQAGFNQSLKYDFTRSRMLMHDIRSTGYGPLEALSYMWAVWRLSQISRNYMTQITNQQLWFERFPETFQAAKIINQHVMQMFVDLCRQNNIRLAYVLLPTKIDIEPDDMMGVVSRGSDVDKHLTLDDVRKFDNAVADEVLREGKELNVNVVDLRPHLLSQKHVGRLYYKNDMHLTPYGNSLVADVLASLIRGSGASLHGEAASSPTAERDLPHSEWKVQRGASARTVVQPHSGSK